MKSILFLFLVMLSTSGCNSNGSDSTTLDFPEGLQTNQSINVLDEQRSFHLFLPTNPQTAPIVLLLHGNRGSSDQIIGLDGTAAPHKVWLDIALRENLILIIPNGSVGPEGHQGWNDCRSASSKLWKRPSLEPRKRTLSK